MYNKENTNFKEDSSLKYGVILENINTVGRKIK